MDIETPGLIVIDDLMNESSKDSAVADIFTKYSHHKNISVIFIVQNLFHKGAKMRDISLNSHYLVIFKNPRDKHQIYHLARQFKPDNSKSVLEAFQDATETPHSYLMFDLTQNTPEILRMRAHIFPDEQMAIYATGKHVNKPFLVRTSE